MKRSRTGKDEPGYEEAKRAFAELGFDLDTESVDAQSRRSGLTDPHPLDPHADWDAFVTAVAPDLRDPWRDTDLDPTTWSTAIPVEIISEFELDPFDLTLEFDHQVGKAQLDALSALIGRAARTSGTDADGHISWVGDVRAVHSQPGLDAATWTLDAASAGPRTIERLIDSVVRGVVDLAIPVRRVIIGQLT
jgi:hypothetical protein